MARIIRVLKTFTFTYADVSTKVGKETTFEPGVHEVSDEVANHPWIKSGADGKVVAATSTTPINSPSARRAVMPTPAGPTPSGAKPDQLITRGI
jgi:hypothetical protein